MSPSELPIALDGCHEQSHARQTTAIVDGTSRREDESALFAGLLEVAQEFADDAFFIVAAVCKWRQLSMDDRMRTIFADFRHRQRRSEIRSLQIDFRQQRQQMSHRRIAMLETVMLW